MHNIYLWWAIRLSLEMSDGFKGCLNEKSSLNSVWYNLIRKIKKKNNYQPLVFTNYIPLEVIILFLNNQYWFQFSSVAQSCPTLCSPVNHSTPCLPVHHQLPEFTQTHIHRVGDAIQPAHPLSSPSFPAPNPSQHQSLFQWVNSSHEVAKVLEFQL